MLCRTDREYILTRRAVYVASRFHCFAPLDKIHEVRAVESLYEKDLFSVDIDVFIMIRKTFILVLFTLNMKTSRTFSSVLENFQKSARTLLPI